MHMFFTGTLCYQPESVKRKWHGGCNRNNPWGHNGWSFHNNGISLNQWRESGMAVVIETTLGDITVDLFTEERPRSKCNQYYKPHAPTLHVVFASSLFFSWTSRSTAIQDRKVNQALLITAFQGASLWYGILLLDVNIVQYSWCSCCVCRPTVIKNCTVSFYFTFPSGLLYGIHFWLLLMLIKNPYPLVTPVIFFGFKLRSKVHIIVLCIKNIFSSLELVYISIICVMDGRWV
jgi:hypothetical protein